jgi:hypothetical protein
MRTIMIFVIAFSLLNMISAQESKDLVYEKKQDNIKTLFGDQTIVHGGYGAFTFGYSEIENLSTVVMGGRGAWIIGHWFALGAGGTGFINDIRYNSMLDENVNLAGGYGGLVLEPIILPWFPVHITFPVLFGAGGIAYVTSYGSNNTYDPPTWVEDAASFVILEPGAELEFNVIRFFRLSLGISYRLTTEINLYDTSTFPLNGWSGNVALKFGKF